MLVLTRRINECVKIGEDIQVMVVGIRPDKVRLGFDAPENVNVHRIEVAERIKKEGQTRGVPKQFSVIDVRSECVIRSFDTQMQAEEFAENDTGVETEIVDNKQNREWAMMKALQDLVLHGMRYAQRDEKLAAAIELAKEVI